MVICQEILAKPNLTMLTLSISCLNESKGKDGVKINKKSQAGVKRVSLGFYNLLSRFDDTPLRLVITNF